MSSLNSIFYSKKHIFELYSDENDKGADYHNMSLSLNKVTDESSWWSVLHRITPIVSTYYSCFVQKVEKEISFQGDLSVDGEIYSNIHGTCSFLTNDYWVQYDDLIELNYKLYNADNELLFEFHSDFSHVDGNNVNYVHQNISDLTFIH